MGSGECWICGERSDWSIYPGMDFLFVFISLAAFIFCLANMKSFERIKSSFFSFVELMMF